jgi:hypothetical protein|tara:strand:- start:2765 stop:3124 length:360 start_codon:yes stop_codon:yes gene_type:complete
MTFIDDVVATGRKVAQGASKLGRKVVGVVKTGVKIGDRALNALGTGVDVISGIPIVGSALKPFTEPVKQGIEAGKKVVGVVKAGVRTAEGVLDTVDTVVGTQPAGSGQMRNGKMMRMRQ